MALTVWLDRIAEVWGSIDDHQGKKLRSYYMFKKAEFPESLKTFPAVLSYLPRVPKADYSMGGPCVILYNGVSEFHLWEDRSKGHYPDLMTYYEKIIRAAAANLTLGGRVEHFLLAANDPIVPGVLGYGTEAPHLGIVVQWQVKEILQDLQVETGG